MAAAEGAGNANGIVDVEWVDVVDGMAPQHNSASK
jgi:hypothetical protein